MCIIEMIVGAEPSSRIEEKIQWGTGMYTSKGATYSKSGTTER